MAETGPDVVGGGYRTREHARPHRDGHARWNRLVLGSARRGSIVTVENSAIRTSLRSVAVLAPKVVLGEQWWRLGLGEDTVV